MGRQGNPRGFVKDSEGILLVEDTGLPNPQKANCSTV